MDTTGTALLVSPTIQEIVQLVNSGMDSPVSACNVPTARIIIQRPTNANVLKVKNGMEYDVSPVLEVECGTRIGVSVLWDISGTETDVLSLETISVPIFQTAGGMATNVSVKLTSNQNTPLKIHSHVSVKAWKFKDFAICVTGDRSPNTRTGFASVLTVTIPTPRDIAKKALPIPTLPPLQTVQWPIISTTS
mgnify:CR=1 FL=1